MTTGRVTSEFFQKIKTKAQRDKLALELKYSLGSYWSAAVEKESEEIKNKRIILKSMLRKGK